MTFYRQPRFWLGLCIVLVGLAIVQQVWHWEVERIECDSASVKVAGDGPAYRVEQAVTKEGDQSATVRFFVRKGKAGPLVPVGMAVSCFGMKAEAKP